MDGEVPQTEPRRRQKKTLLACLPCQRSHYPCDENRPCQSCTRRGRATECVDGVKKRAKYMETHHSPDDELMLLARSANTEDTPVSACYAVLRPFNYGSSYHRLLEMLQRRQSKGESMSRVCRAMARFRPGSIALVRSLQDADLLLSEQSFQRTLIELSRVLPLSSAPYCVWRRTGEVCWASREFCIITGWSAQTLQGGRTMMELLDDHGVVDYWESYARCVIDCSLNHFRICTGLFRPDGKTVQGSLWVTIRKNIFDIPFALVGCFLPDLWHSVPVPPE